MLSTSYVGKLHNTKYLCLRGMVYISFTILYVKWHGYGYNCLQDIDNNKESLLSYIYNWMVV